MRRIKMIVVTAGFAVAILAGYRVGWDEVANIELQGDLHDLASQSRNYVRYTPPRTDEELREAVISKAKEHDIELEPSQVTVEQTGSAATPTVYLAAQYSVPVNLWGFSFTMHFTPSSEKHGF